MVEYIVCFVEGKPKSFDNLDDARKYAIANYKKGAFDFTLHRQYLVEIARKSKADSRWVNEGTVIVKSASSPYYFLRYHPKTGTNTKYEIDKKGRIISKNLFAKRR